MKTKKIHLTEDQIQLLKQALLIAELDQEKQYPDIPRMASRFKDLHIQIDEQL